MMQNELPENMNNKKVANILLLLFFAVSFLEIIAEYNQDKLFIWITKPLILPILIFYYIRCSKEVSQFFVVALMSSWIANMLFIQNTFQYIFYGVLFFVIYRILVIYIVVNKVKMPTSIPLVLGATPFIFLYLIVTFFSYDELGNNVYLFLLQGLFTIFLGGFSLGNYIMESSKTNSILFISTMFMALNQFIFLMKLYFDDVNLLQSLAMLLFVMGQFLLTKYMFYTEHLNSQYKLTDNLKNES